MRRLIAPRLQLRGARIEETRGGRSRAGAGAGAREHSCIMRAYIGSASCAVSRLLALLLIAVVSRPRRLPGCGGAAGGGLEGGLPHGLLLGPELRPVGSQSPRQPARARASQTGEPDERMSDVGGGGGGGGGGACGSKSSALRGAMEDWFFNSVSH